jgi:hypothetical protein
VNHAAQTTRPPVDVFLVAVFLLVAVFVSTMSLCHVKQQMACQTADGKNALTCNYRRYLLTVTATLRGHLHKPPRHKVPASFVTGESNVIQ